MTSTDGKRVEVCTEVRMELAAFNSFFGGDLNASYTLEVNGRIYPGCRPLLKYDVVTFDLSEREIAVWKEPEEPLGEVVRRTLAAAEERAHYEEWNPGAQFCLPVGTPLFGFNADQWTFLRRWYAIDFLGPRTLAKDAWAISGMEMNHAHRIRFLWNMRTHGAPVPTGEQKNRLDMSGREIFHD